MDIFVTVSWIAVIVAAVVRIAIGAVWYAPPVFGKQWQVATGVEQGPSEMPQAIAVQALGSLVMAYVLAQVIGHYETDGLLAGALVGILMWVGFVATIMLPGVLFEKRSLGFFGIYSGYQLVTLAIMGAIIGAL
ncbi:MAG: DUF1761 domain-containing protein [Dongiaceae bacterium]